VGGRVGDARAGRADTGDVVLAVLELGGDGGGLSGSAGKELEAERGGKLRVTVVDEVAVAVVRLAVRVLPGLGEAGGRHGQNNSGLHIVVVLLLLLGNCNSEGFPFFKPLSIYSE
jgi:hypothetical protein